jgi:hypothetical protein
MNQYYNKEKAQLQSIYDKQGIKFGNKKPIWERRTTRISFKFHTLG